MWVKQCHKPPVISILIKVDFLKLSQSWVVYGIVLPTWLINPTGITDLVVVTYFVGSAWDLLEDFRHSVWGTFIDFRRFSNRFSPEPTCIWGNIWHIPTIQPPDTLNFDSGYSVSHCHRVPTPVSSSSQGVAPMLGVGVCVSGGPRPEAAIFSTR